MAVYGSESPTRRGCRAVPPKVKRFLKYRPARQLRDNADRDSCPILLKRAHKIP